VDIKTPNLNKNRRTAGADSEYSMFVEHETGHSFVRSLLQYSHMIDTSRVVISRSDREGPPIELVMPSVAEMRWDARFNSTTSPA